MTNEEMDETMAALDKEIARLTNAPGPSTKNWIRIMERERNLILEIKTLRGEVKELRTALTNHRRIMSRCKRCEKATPFLSI